MRQTTRIANQRFASPLEPHAHISPPRADWSILAVNTGLSTRCPFRISVSSHLISSSIDQAHSIQSSSFLVSGCCCIDGLPTYLSCIMDLDHPTPISKESLDSAHPTAIFLEPANTNN